MPLFLALNGADDDPEDDDLDDEDEDPEDEEEDDEDEETWQVRLTCQ